MVPQDVHASASTTFEALDFDYDRNNVYANFMEKHKDVAKPEEEIIISASSFDSAASSELLSQGPFIMNIRNHTLEKSGNRVKLTQVEYAIMKLFMQNPGRALSREDILAAVWGRDYEGELKIVDVNIRRLRIKIEDDTANPAYITTVWGYGYKWGA